MDKLPGEPSLMREIGLPIIALLIVFSVASTFPGLVSPLGH